MVAIAVVAALLGSALAVGAQTSRRVAAPAVTTEDVDALKSQLRALQDRLSQLEQAQAAQAGQVAEATKIVAEQQKSAAEQQESLDRAVDNVRTSASGSVASRGRATCATATRTSSRSSRAPIATGIASVRDSASSRRSTRRCAPRYS
jgi:uncharacterized coiled-coil protein SlyX